MKLSKREKSLIGILFGLGIIFILNTFIIKPTNIKLVELHNEKQNIINIKNNIQQINQSNSIKEIDKEEDIVLKIEKEIRQFATIDYIDKKIVWDENNNDEINIELKVNGNLENVLKIDEAINKLELSKNIKYIEINKVNNINDTEEIDNLENLVECIMTFKVV
ncbi:MAG: hypothetical protein RSD22_05265 [Romboutsia sp.]